MNGGRFRQSGAFSMAEIDLWKAIISPTVLLNVIYTVDYGMQII